MDSRETLFQSIQNLKEEILQKRALGDEPYQLIEKKSELLEKLRRLDRKIDIAPPSNLPKKPLSKEPTALEKFHRAMERAHHYQNRKRSLLGMLFGRHPKAMMAHAFFDAQKEAGEIQAPDKAKLFAQKFAQRLQKRWNHRFYGEEFAELYEEWSDIKKTLESEGFLKR